MKRGQGIYKEGYFKVSRRLLESSLWCENGDVIKVFLALVAMSQDPGGPRNGAVFIARKQLAAKMFLSEERLQECLSVLASPDDESRTQDRDGRRIEILPNGFRVLNYGLYHDEANDVLLTRLRSEAGRVGGLASAKVRWGKDKIVSKTQASRKQIQPTETETEKRQDGNGVTASVATAPAPWTREACDDWIARFKGSAPGGRIGKALKPLVGAHGWPEVRAAWQSYLSQSEAEFASAERFAATYGRWSGECEGPKSKAQQVVDETKAVLERFVARGRE